MQKIILGNKVIACLSNGTMIEKECTETELGVLERINTDEEALLLLCPSYKEALVQRNKALSLMDRVKNSAIITLKDCAYYWEDVSPLSVPADLVSDIITAEENNDEAKLEAYKNFWILLSLNTDEECRNNLYWFLQNHGLVIAKCGFFIAYRNVVKTKTPNVYTDQYTHTFSIKIGEMVVMDRKLVDSDSNVECGRGLHCGGTNWLEMNYFGDTGLACLVNPADVCAVPKRSNYGKLRTCAYLPISTIEFDGNNHVIPLDVETGFDCSYVSKVIYEGIMGTEEDSPYKIHIPDTYITKVSIQDSLLEIAKKSITNRWV